MIGVGVAFYLVKGFVFLLLLLSYNNLAPRRIGNCHLGSGGGGRGGRGGRSWHIWMDTWRQHRDPTKWERDRERDRGRAHLCSMEVQHRCNKCNAATPGATRTEFFSFLVLRYGGSKLEANREVRNFWVFGWHFGDSNYTPGVNFHPWVVF